jgi:hypothetical protein
MSGDEDDPLCQTTQVSVATLRDLVARASDERLDGAPEPRESPPTGWPAAEEAPLRREASAAAIELLSRGAPVLVFPEPPAAPAPVPIPEAPAAASFALDGLPLPYVVVAARPVQRVRRVRAEHGTARRGFLKRRLVALALLAVAVAAQPWWWNLGDVRPHPSAGARAAQSPR